MIVKLKGGDGYPVLFNTDHVVSVLQAYSQAQNGSAKQVLIGKVVVSTVGGGMILVDATWEEIYGALRRGEPSANGAGVLTAIK